MHEISGHDSNTAVGDIVCVTVDSSNSYGVNFVSDASGFGAIIGSWERAYGGNFGVVQKHGGVHVGDYLFAVNDNMVGSVAHLEVLSILNDRNILKKSLVFMSQSEYGRRKKADEIERSGLVMKDTNKNFLSVIRRTRINGSPGNGTARFVEYEIACQIRLLAGTLVEKEIVYKWCVWKRFSQFLLLHKAIQKSLGWLMKSKNFPPSRSFVYDKTSLEFIEKRREELNTYWQDVLSIDKITDFKKHHSSQDIKSFLDFDLYVESTEASNNAYPGVTATRPAISSSSSSSSSSSNNKHRSDSNSKTNSNTRNNQQSLSLLRRRSEKLRSLQNQQSKEFSTPLKTASTLATIPPQKPPCPTPINIKYDPTHSAVDHTSQNTIKNKVAPSLTSSALSSSSSTSTSTSARNNLLSSIKSLKRIE